MAPHIRSHRAPCSYFLEKVSLQPSSEQSVYDFRITQLDWWKRVPQARSRGCKSSVAITTECLRHHVRPLWTSLKKHDSSDTEDHCIVHYSVLSRDVLFGHFASCVVIIDSVFRLDQPNWCWKAHTREQNYRVGLRRSTVVIDLPNSTFPFPAMIA